MNELDELSVSEKKEALKILLRPYIKRLVIVVIISTLLALAFNELAFAFTREAYDRKSETITLEIPAGTAKRVATGETPPDIPADLTFVVGDVLEVVNKDSEPHQLGPLFIPAGRAAKLAMDNANRMTYQCSFRSGTMSVCPITTRSPSRSL